MMVVDFFILMRGWLDIGRKIVVAQSSCFCPVFEGRLDTLVCKL